MKTILKQLLCISVGFLTVVLFNGCSTPRSFSERPPKGEAVVFGNFTLTSKIGGQGMWGASTVADIIDIRTSRIMFRYPLSREGGPFYWHLPPGKYAVLGVTVKGAVGLDSHMQNYRVFAEFSVLSTDSTFYIGNLILQQANGNVSSSVRDDQESAVQRLRSKYPNLSDSINKNLMRLEKR